MVTWWLPLVLGCGGLTGSDPPCHPETSLEVTDHNLLTPCQKRLPFFFHHPIKKVTSIFHHQASKLVFFFSIRASTEGSPFLLKNIAFFMSFPLFFFVLEESLPPVGSWMCEIWCPHTEERRCWRPRNPRARNQRGAEGRRGRADATGEAGGGAGGGGTEKLGRYFWRCLWWYFFEGENEWGKFFVL